MPSLSDAVSLQGSEAFLQKLMALFVSSHYKNRYALSRRSLGVSPYCVHSPNDLQLMSDAPAHHIFVLLGPVTSETQVPDILCAIQVQCVTRLLCKSLSAFVAVHGRRDLEGLCHEHTGTRWARIRGPDSVVHFPTVPGGLNKMMRVK